MTKGLPRSNSRGPKSLKAVYKQRVLIRDKTVTVSATGSAIGFGSVVIEDLPEGNILLLGAVGYVAFAGSGSDDNLTDTWSGDYGVGTTPADDATITGEDVNILASTAIGAAVGEAIARTRSVNSTSAIIDNTDGSKELNLNVLVDAANIVDDESVDLTVNGEVEILYSVMLND